MQEGLVRLHDIVRCHIKRYYASGCLCHFYSPADKRLILNKISFDVEIVIAFEILRLQIFRNELKRSSQIDGKGPLGIGCGYENHCFPRGFRAFEEHGFDPILLLVTFEKVAEVIVADFADESGLHPEDGSTGDCVGR